MKKYTYPDISQWSSICERPTFDLSEMEGKVKAILNEVKEFGDQSLFTMSERFDGVTLESLALDLSGQNFEIDADLADSIRTAKANIEMFHISQEEEVREIETMNGVRCWRKSVAIQNVGLYIPGGSAPLFST
ncbi:MAG: histidinol dehydrogenase, partial [Ekhidna sp.]|nr:histidinol dehydrogenase [Ekhidna sp.]